MDRLGWLTIGEYLLKLIAVTLLFAYTVHKPYAFGNITYRAKWRAALRCPVYLALLLIVLTFVCDIMRLALLAKELPQ